jgi:hypothetical protein
MLLALRFPCLPRLDLLVLADLALHGRFINVFGHCCGVLCLLG